MWPSAIESLPADVLVILDSMKMEARVVQRKPGVVGKIFVSVGDVVCDGDPLMIIED